MQRLAVQQGMAACWLLLAGQVWASGGAESPAKVAPLPVATPATATASGTIVSKKITPEKLAPSVRQSPPPEAKLPTGLSPVVRPPEGTVSAPVKAAKKPVHAARALRSKPKPAPRMVVAHAHESEHGSEQRQVHGMLNTLLSANARYMSQHSAGYYQKFANKQSPWATVVTCSDSRVQTPALHGDATNQLFMVRDIGNQLATAEGSVEYGVRHLHTPFLIFIGHSVCGAVTAAAGDYGKLEPAIRKELAGINIPKGIDVTDGALLNVNNQVEGAILKFSGEVEAGHLAVIGAYYDFRNDLHQGAGRLVITNINGETEPARIRALLHKGELFKYRFMDAAH